MYVRSCRLPRPGSDATNTGRGACAEGGYDWDAQVARTSPEEETRHAREIDRYFRALLELDGLPYARRIENVLRIKPAVGTGPLSFVAASLMDRDRMEAVVRAQSRTIASLRADMCLLALRLWRLSNRGLPKNLASIVVGAGLKSVPIDPYDGTPCKFTAFNGEPLVYSVGRDGKDDGGLVDSDRDQRPTGDLIYRLPAIEVKHALKALPIRESANLCDLKPPASGALELVRKWDLTATTPNLA